MMDVFKIEFITGEKGKTLLLVDNFKFSYDKRLATSVHRWRCTRKKCKAFFKLDEDNKPVDYFNYHEHKPLDANLLARQKLSNSLKLKALDDFAIQPSKLIKTELMKDDIHTTLTVDDLIRVRKNINYAKASKLRKISKSYEECNDAIDQMNMLEDLLVENLLNAPLEGDREWQTEPYTSKILQQLKNQPNVFIKGGGSNGENRNEIQLSKMFENVEKKLKKTKSGKLDSSLKNRFIDLFGSTLDDLNLRERHNMIRGKHTIRVSLPLEHLKEHFQKIQSAQITEMQYNDEQVSELVIPPVFKETANIVKEGLKKATKTKIIQGDSETVKSTKVIAPFIDLTETKDNVSYATIPVIKHEAPDKARSMPILSPETVNNSQSLIVREVPPNSQIPLPVLRLEVTQQHPSVSVDSRIKTLLQTNANHKKRQVQKSNQANGGLVVINPPQSIVEAAIQQQQRSLNQSDRIHYPNLQASQILPTTYSQLPLLRPTMEFQLISNYQCALHISEYVNKVLEVKIHYTKFYQNIKNIFPPVIQKEHCHKINAYFIEVVSMFGRLLCKKLAIYDVQNYSIIEILQITVNKLNLSNHNVSVYAAAFYTRNMLGPNINFFKTPFLQKLFCALDMVIRTFEKKTENVPIINEKQLQLLKIQIEYNLRILNWLKTVYNQPRPQKRKHSLPPNTESGKILLLQNAGLQAQPPTSANTMQAQPQSANQVKSLTQTVCQISANTLPQSDNHVNSLPQTVSINIMQPLNAILRNVNTVEPPRAIIRNANTVEPPSAIIRNANTVEPPSANRSHSQNIVELPHANAPQQITVQPQSTSDDTVQSQNVKVEEEVSSTVKHETDVIDLTWIDDYDDVEILDEIIQLKTLPFKIDKTENESESSREVASPTDSGVGSPVSQNENNDGYKCLCGNRAIYVCACNSSMYCSRDCQAKDWVYHQKLCHKIMS